MASVKITIFDGAIPLLDEIGKVSYGLALDALDQAGTVIRERSRQAFRGSTPHHWSMVISKTGKRRVVRSKEMQETGMRRSHITGQIENPKNMESFITSYLMEKSLTMVVGGKHKSFRPKRRRDGNVTGYLPRVGGVSEASYGILKKLDDGDENDPSYKKAVKGRGRGLFPNAKYQRRDFMAKGRSHAMPEVQYIMTKKLESLIGKQVNRANLKTQVRAS